MSKTNKFCQSCGMPISKDPQGGGTNADGTQNETYCSYCYQNGKFTCGEMTVGEFQEFCRRKMVENGYNRLMAWLLTRGMSRLERWKNSGN
ncbi:MAG: zinc ribbon domain-containing protein [Prevotellaceae bacterium]|nr:zinc ribbon domain-containing protein [Prevotellaceae bacterium]